MERVWRKKGASTSPSEESGSSQDRDPAPAANQAWLKETVATLNNSGLVGKGLSRAIAAAIRESKIPGAKVGQDPSSNESSLLHVAESQTPQSLLQSDSLLQVVRSQTPLSLLHGSMAAQEHAKDKTSQKEVVTQTPQSLLHRPESLATKSLLHSDSLLQVERSQTPQSLLHGSMEFQEHAYGAESTGGLLPGTESGNFPESKPPTPT